jgi:hypothetical protein
MSRQLFAAERQFAAVGVEDAPRLSELTQRLQQACGKNSVLYQGTTLVVP